MRLQEKLLGKALAVSRTRKSYDFEHEY